MQKLFLLLAIFLFLVRPVFAQTNLAVLAPDGAWTWYNDPRALFHNGIFYIGYVRGGDGRTALSAFDPQTGARTLLWESALTQKDDHNNPGLLVKQDGTLLAIHARHGTDQFFSYRLSNSTNPISPTNWSAEMTIANTGAGVTYANPYQLTAEPTRIYNYLRDLNFNPTVIVSTNGGATWGAPQLFIRNGNGSVRPYVKYASDYASRIEFLYTDGHPRDITNSLYHLYYENGAYRKTDGTLVKDFSALPIQHTNNERGSVIYQYSDAATNDPNAHIPTGRAWCWETTYQSNGNPVCVFTVQRDQVTGSNWFDDRIYYYYARWTGTSWQKRFIAHAGRPLYQAEDDYAGGICIDPNNANTIYISSNAQNPFDLSSTTAVPLRANQRYELYRGTTTDDGLTFSWVTVTTNSVVDNLRPYIPRHQSGTNPTVIWFRGTYSTYTSYNCEVVGLFATALPQLPAINLIHPKVPSLALTNLNNELKLKAELKDDGLPQPSTILWTTVSGPANAVFSHANQLSTTARFPTNGIYVLRVTADDTLAAPFAEVTVSAGAIADNQSDPSRVLWLKLDETSGAVANDGSGNGNNGVVAGGAIFRPTGGVRGGALELDGVNEEVIVPDSTALDNTIAFTLSYWFFAKSFPFDSAGLVCKRNGPADNNAYTMYLKNDNRIYVDIDTANNRFSSSLLYTTGQWYHVVLTFDGVAPAASRAKLWINGLLDTTATESSAAIPNYNSALRVGNTHTNVANWMNGFFDDVQFYRRALSGNEILALALNKFAPSVSVVAGPITNGIPAPLNGNVIPGSSTNSISTFWEEIAGAGNTVFANPFSTATTVTFNRSGNYTLQLSADDGQIAVAQNLPLAVVANTNVFSDWTALVFPGQTNVSSIGAAADPDGDGLSNFAEFALNLNPNVSDAHVFQTGQPGLPIARIINFSGTNFLAMLVKRPIGRIGVSYDAQATADFQAWMTVGLSGIANNGDATETLTFRDVVPVTNATQRFLRLQLNPL